MVMEGILAEAPFEVVGVTAGVPFEPVVAAAPRQVVVTGPPVKPIIPGITTHGIVAVASPERVLATVTDKLILPVIALQRIVAVATGQHVLGLVTIEGLPFRRRHSRQQGNHIRIAPSGAIGKADLVQHITAGPVTQKIVGDRQLIIRTQQLDVEGTA